MLAEPITSAQRSNETRTVTFNSRKSHPDFLAFVVAHFDLAAPHQQTVEVVNGGPNPAEQDAFRDFADALLSRHSLGGRLTGGDPEKHYLSSILTGNRLVEVRIQGELLVNFMLLPMAGQS